MSNPGASDYTVLGYAPSAAPPQQQQPPPDGGSGYTVLGYVPGAAPPQQQQPQQPQQQPQPQPQSQPAAGGPYDDIVNQAAQQYGFDPAFLHRVFQTESSMNPNAVSPKGAAGLGGLMPGTAQDLGVTDVTDPRQNAFASARYLRQLITKYGDTPTALAAYNWGQGNVDRLGANNAPPETHNYVRTINGDGGAQAPGSMSYGQAPGGERSFAYPDPPPAPASAPVNAPAAQGQEDYTQIGQADPKVIDQMFGQPQGEPPPWYSMSEVPGALAQGIGDAASEAAQTASGQAFSGQPSSAPKPRSFMGEAAYGLAHSFPLIGGAIAGGAAGEAVAPEGGPIGPLVGAAAGMGGTAAFQAIKPGYDDGIAKGMTHDQAVDYAIKRATTEGGIAAATAPLYEIPWVRSQLGRLLITSLGTQPAVGAATRIIEPAITGDPAPTGDELLRGAGQDIVGGLALGAAHHALGKALPQKKVELPPLNLPEEVTPAEALAHAQTQTAALDAKLQGTPETKLGDKVVPAVPGQPLTEAESAERKFLEQNAQNPRAIAEAYGARLKDEELPPSPQGEADATVPPAEHAAVPPEATATGEEPASAVQPGRQQETAGDLGDQAGGLRPAETPREGIPAEATRPGGDVQSAGVDPAAARPDLVRPDLAAEAPLHEGTTEPDVAAHGAPTGQAETLSQDKAGPHAVELSRPHDLQAGDVVTNDQGEKTTILSNTPLSAQNDRLIEYRDPSGKVQADKASNLDHLVNPSVRYADGQREVSEAPTVMRGAEAVAPEKTGKISIGARTVNADGTVQTAYHDGGENPVGYSVHTPSENKLNTVRVTEENRGRGYGEQIVRHLADNEGVRHATAGSYEGDKLLAKVGKNVEGNRYTLEPRTGAEAVRPAEAPEVERQGQSYDGEEPVDVLPGGEAAPGTEPPLSQAGQGQAEGEAPVDTKTAADPRNQKKLDDINQQLADQQAKGVASPKQIKKLTATRDKLLAKTLPRPKKPVNTDAPPAPGEKKKFLDYKMQKGTPIYRDAFVQHALDGGASPQEARDFAAQAINRPIHWQVETLRAQVKNKFGFSDVRLNKTMDLYDARNLLLDLHRAVTDMMHSLGVPSELASFMGKLDMELHPLTRGKPFGSYTWGGTKTISIFGRPSVFGHEWVHALDHDIVETLLKNKDPKLAETLATTLGRKGLLDPKNPMAVRMGHLINTLFHDTTGLAAKKIDLQMRAQAKDKNGLPTKSARDAQADLNALEIGAKTKEKIPASKYYEEAWKSGGGKGMKSYWTDERELMARAGEAYIARLMENKALDPRGAVMPDEGYLADTDTRLRHSFPKGQERADIFQAFDHLMDGYRQEALAGSPAAAQALRDGISDPRVWGKLAANPNHLGPLKDLISRMRNFQDTLSRTALTDPTRPDPGARNAWQRAKIAAMETFHSRMGLLEGLHELMPTQRAKDALQKTMDRLGMSVGKGRYTGWETIEERVHILTRKAIGQFGNILKNAGFDPDSFTKEQGAHLRHVMTTGETSYPTDPLNSNSARVPVDKNIVNAAGFLRSISDRFFQQLRDANVDIGYAQNGHFLRLYDQVRAHSDPVGFVKAASTLHKLMFDRDVGTPGDHPDRLLSHWRSLGKDRQQQMDPAVQAGMKQLAETLRKQRELKADIDKNGMTAAKQAEMDRLQQDAEQLAIDHHDDVGHRVANINANNWLMNLRKMYADDWDKTGPGGNFANKRTLPPEADQIMRDYMHTDPLTVLPRYYESAARKIAYAERFGAKDEIREHLMNEMLNGGAHPEDVATVKKVIDSVSGKTNNNNSRGITMIANAVHAGAALGLMARAPYSMMAEPFVVGLSHGSMRAGLKGFLAQFSNVMRTADAKERAELADWIGVTTSSMHDDIMMNRTGADYSDSPMIGKLMSQFYRATWMTQWTNANRRASMVGGDYMMNKWSRDILNTSQSAGAQDKRAAARKVFNELGIAPQLHEDFARWKSSLDGMPDIDTVESHRFGHEYALAMRRIVDRSVIDPKKIERPLTTDNSWLKLLFQFQTYNYGFQRNVLDPMLHRFGDAYRQGYQRGMDANQGKIVSMVRGGGNAAWQVGHVGAIAGTYVGINMLTSALRQYLFNQDDWKKHEDAGDLEEYLTDIAMSRSGLSGTLDPLIQVATNLRYNQDLSSLLQGPGIKWYAKNAYDVFSGFANPSGEQSGSNLRAHEAVKGLYNLIGTPTAAFLATKIAAFGPLGVLAGGAADQYASSPQFAEGVADYITGPKGATLPKENTSGELGGLDKMGSDLGGIDQGVDGGGGTEGISDAQNAGAVPWGLMDDFIAPAWRIAKPLVDAVPRPIKAVAGVGAAAYAAKDYWDKYEDYRDQPPPEPKQQQGATP